MFCMSTYVCDKLLLTIIAFKWIKFIFRYSSHYICFFRQKISKFWNNLTYRQDWRQSFRCSSLKLANDLELVFPWSQGLFTNYFSKMKMLRTYFLERRINIQLCSEPWWAFVYNFFCNHGFRQLQCLQVQTSKGFLSTKILRGFLLKRNFWLKRHL